MDELWEDYLQYLIWRCNLQKERGMERIFETLHDLEFTYVMDRDENRYADGVELRDDYEIPDCFMDLEDEFLDRNCSVLEMLIALSIRVDDDFIGDPAEPHPEDFFIEMIENLKLDRYSGRSFYEKDVIKIIQRWLERRFNQDGCGSPFPLRHDKRNQRDLEIWDQMNSYISENYG